MDSDGQSVYSRQVRKRTKTTHHGTDESDEDIPLHPCNRQKTYSTT